MVTPLLKSIPLNQQSYAYFVVCGRKLLHLNIEVIGTGNGRVGLKDGSNDSQAQAGDIHVYDIYFYKVGTDGLCPEWLYGKSVPCRMPFEGILSLRWFLSPQPQARL